MKNFYILKLSKLHTYKIPFLLFIILLVINLTNFTNCMHRLSSNKKFSSKNLSLNNNIHKKLRSKSLRRASSGSNTIIKGYQLAIKSNLFKTFVSLEIKRIIEENLDLEKYKINISKFSVGKDSKVILDISNNNKLIVDYKDIIMKASYRDNNFEINIRSLEMELTLNLNKPILVNSNFRVDIKEFKTGTFVDNILGLIKLILNPPTGTGWLFNLGKRLGIYVFNYFAPDMIINVIEKYIPFSINPSFIEYPNIYKHKLNNNYSVKFGIDGTFYGKKTPILNQNTFPDELCTEKDLKLLNFEDSYLKENDLGVIISQKTVNSFIKAYSDLQTNGIIKLPMIFPLNIIADSIRVKDVSIVFVDGHIFYKGMLSIDESEFKIIDVMFKLNVLNTAAEFNLYNDVGINVKNSFEFDKNNTIIITKVIERIIRMTFDKLPDIVYNIANKFSELTPVLNSIRVYNCGIFVGFNFNVEEEYNLRPYDVAEFTKKSSKIPAMLQSPNVNTLLKLNNRNNNNYNY